MTFVTPNSVAGINSIAAQTSSVSVYDASGNVGTISGNLTGTIVGVSTAGITSAYIGTVDATGFTTTTFASRNDIAGITTSATTTSGSANVTLNGTTQAANIFNGYTVTGNGISTGTVVSSGGQTINLVLSQTAGVTTTTNVLTFYTNSKPISPGGLGGMLASTEDVIGISTTASTTLNSNTITLTNSNISSQISPGFSVAGSGIRLDTLVSSVSGTNVGLSKTVGITSSINPLTFYSNSKLVTPGDIGGMLCRAWVNFDGTTAGTRTFTSSSGIRASYNVSSITYLTGSTTASNTGLFRINFTNSMSDTNYVVVGNCASATADNIGRNLLELGPAANQLTTSALVITGDSSVNLTENYATVCVAIFR